MTARSIGVGRVSEHGAAANRFEQLYRERSDCPSLHSIAYATRLPGESVTAGTMAGDDGSHSVTVDVQAAAASDTTAVATFVVNPDGSTAGEVAFVTGTPPSCVSLP